MSVSSYFKELQPATWRIVPGEEVATYAVEKDSREFNFAGQKFVEAGMKIIEIQRLQNLFMWGRYVIRRQQIRQRSPGYLQEQVLYSCVRVEDVPLVKDYNLDSRRVKLSVPIFATDPLEAYKKCVYQNKVVVVCRVLQEDGTTNLYRPKFDSEVYPDYFVKCVF